MKYVNKEILKDERILTQFISELLVLPDTPALIQFVTANEDYLLLCSRIVNDSNNRSRELQVLKDICRKHKYDFLVLKEKLTPVARAFRLVEDESDYYDLLGVPRDADTNEIKKAFRKKVIGVHPDTGDQISHSDEKFISLQTAYQILADPRLRRQYDENIDNLNLWKEKTNYFNRLPGFHRFNPGNSRKINQRENRRTKIFCQLGGLFLFLIIAVFIFDFFYKQNSIFDGDHLERQKQITRTKTQEESTLHNYNSNTGQKHTEVKLSSSRSDNSRKIFKSNDSSLQANEEANVAGPKPGSK